MLIVSLAATGLGTFYVDSASRSKQRIRFENAAKLTTQRISSHLETYVALLNGAQGLFAASDQVTFEDFRNYIQHLELKSRYPGIQGIGFAQRVSEGQRNDSVSHMREQGLREFRIWPEGNRPEYFPIVYLEPLDWRNRLALGFDMFAEPTRRAAMEQARDTGRPAASGKVRLQQETDEQTQAGFLIYIPVYNRGTTPRSLTERRAGLEGFVYSPFRCDDLLLNMLSGKADLGVEVEFYDTVSDAKNLLHDSRRFGRNPSGPRPPDLSYSNSFHIGGHTFALRMTPGPTFDAGSPDDMPMLALLSGIALSVLLYSATASLAQARTAAERIASELRQTEAMRIRRTRHHALRADVSTAMTASELPAREVLQLCAEAATRHVKAALVRIWTIRPGEDVLELQASAGLYRHIDGAHSRICLGELKVGRVARERSHQVTQDIVHDPYIAEPEWAKDNGLVSFAGFPLLVEDRLAGVLALFAQEPFTEDTLDALQGMADLLAQGIERRHTEEALRESEERFRATFNQAAAGIALTDPQGRFEQVNARFAEIVGSSREELTRRTWPELIHPDDRDRHSKLYHRLLSGEVDTFTIENRCLCNDGQIAWVNMSMSAVRDPAGRPEHTISVIRDVTARKRAEQTVLAQKRELEDFVSIVAHDLKHPVVSVQGLLGLLRQETAHQLDDGGRENLELAISECDRMRSIIAQLGHIARIGSCDIRPERVRLRAMIEESVRRFKRTIENKHATVSIEAPDITALLPRPQVEEALDNLVDNALQYGCASESPRVALRCTLEGSAVAISVCDNGPGIDPRYHKRVFEMFRRLDPSGPVPGTGVGLTAVQRLIQRVGGTVSLDSAVDRGAVFTIRFPAQVLTEPSASQTR